MTTVLPPQAPPADTAWADRPAKPRVDVTNEAESFELLLKVMSSGDTPDLYVRSGGLNWVSVDDKDDPIIHRLDPDNLLSWFAEHVETYAYKAQGRGEAKEWREVRQYPSGRTCRAILGRERWRLPKLAGVATSPVFRADGSLLQTPGYDRGTGLFLFPRLKGVSQVSEQPTAGDVAQARELLLRMTSDFPWVRLSDRAQYFALALAPIMRPYIPGPTPMGLISATAMGSGKSYLTYLFTELYGMGTLTWPNDGSEELRKAITTKLTTTGAPVITFDNIDNGGTLKSPVLADLLTKSYWEDRQLGSMTNIGAPNDRLWLATGNNIRTGGDMARRVIWVRLDPDCPNPDQRDGFVIGDFQIWVRQNAAAVLRALLTLATGWIAAGAPRRNIRMGSYSEWTSSMAGLLDWAEIPGFMEDRGSTSLDLDEEAGEWHALLATWHRVFGSKPMATKEVLQAADVAEEVPLTNRHERPVPRQLGQWLNARMGRYYGDYRLVRHPGPKNGGALWSVTSLEDKTP